VIRPLPKRGTRSPPSWLEPGVVRDEEKVTEAMVRWGFALALVFYSCSLSIVVKRSGAAERIEKRIEQQKQMDQRLASELQGLITCKSYSGPPEGNLYCHLKFRGLDMDFAGANAPGGGTIYVNSLGKNQILSARGRRCFTIEFKDADLRAEGFSGGATILFRDDATVTHNLNNQKAWKECG